MPMHETRLAGLRPDSFLRVRMADKIISSRIAEQRTWYRRKESLDDFKILQRPQRQTVGTYAVSDRFARRCLSSKEAFSFLLKSPLPFSRHLTGPKVSLILDLNKSRSYHNLGIPARIYQQVGTCESRGTRISMELASRSCMGLSAVMLRHAR
jgi:hypothetical protein